MTQSINPLKGAIASSKFNIPKDVTQAAPNWWRFSARKGTSMPILLVKNLAAYKKTLTKNAGK